jgi:photosystem II stability/assembly factor-like uncharacterized protein
MRVACGLAAAAICVAPASAAPQARYVWDSVAIGGGGFVAAVIPSRSGVTYARTDVGGAYRWDREHGRWLALLDWVSDEQTGYLGVDSLAIDPRDASHIYLLAGISYMNGGRTAILHSTDAGRSFTTVDVSAQFKTHGNGMGRQNGERLAVDPGNGSIVYAGTRWNGLFRSEDAGTTWVHLGGLPVSATPNNAGISLVMPDPASVAKGRAQRLFVGVSRFGSVGPSFYRSDDAGGSFTAVAGAPTAFMPQRAALDGAGNLYVTYANGAGPHPNQSGSEPMDRGQIWRYTIASGTWTEVTPAGWTRAFSGISVDPNNPQRLVASTISTYVKQGDANGDRIFVSNDGGAHWIDVIERGFVRAAAGIAWLAGHAIHWASSVEFDPADPHTVWVTSGNGVFKTADIDAKPATWTFTVKGLEETVPLGLVSVPDGRVVSAIGDYDGFMHDDPARYGRIHKPEMGTTTGIDVAAARPSYMVRVGSAIYMSRDGGASWNKAAAQKGKLGQIAMSADGSVMLHSPARAAVTWRSADWGASWAEVSGLHGANVRPVADQVNPQLFYAYADGALLASVDGGASFERRATLPAGGSNVIRAAPGREGDVWVPLYGGGLARSLDGGMSFAQLAGVSVCGAVGFGKAAHGQRYPTIFIWGTVDGKRGLYRSTDEGASWARINDDQHQFGGPGNGQFVVGDMNRFGVVFMSTTGRGIVYGRPAE